MGKHSRPDVTTEDFPTLPTKAVEDVRADQVFQDFWEDFSDDGKLTPETLSKGKHFLISVAHGVAVAVALEVSPVLWDALAAGDVDLPGIVELVRTAAVGALISHFRPRR
ncbi:hypothetical protein [Actinomadura sp. WMMB 499]|uniref:hypothetical protein n=1 Tax=Actinomadura sp. WMMB 499 TaxID=1219491 RepID=UPI001244922E|nr:hypothetical protein [Actinomadura sp. WMMB 499]QFG25439.1 hypothetical protein F7P10_34045 [Actinomadura sp. WMMB 499]